MTIWLNLFKARHRFSEVDLDDYIPVSRFRDQTLMMGTAMCAETLRNLQYTTRLNSRPEIMH